MSSYGWFQLAVFTGPFLISMLPQFRNFWRHWRALLLGYAAVSLPWILLDALSHARGWWSYSPQHVSSIELLGLPIEEILFFFTVPFACMFVMYVFEARSWSKLTRSSLFAILAVITIACAALAALSVGKERSIVDLVLFLAALGAALKLGYAKQTIFWTWSAAVLILFLVFNSVLTGLPIVVYDEQFMSGVRIGTIPVEDTFYNFAFLWMFLFVFRYARLRKWNW